MKRYKKYKDFARELKKIAKHEGKGENDNSCRKHTRNSSQKLGKKLENLEIGVKIETIRLTLLLRSARILRRVGETWEELMSVGLQWKTTSEHLYEKLNNNNNNNNQKDYKTKHDYVGKVIQYELCKRMNFDHTAKWYMYKPESDLESETRNSRGFWDTNGSLYPSEKIGPSVN